MYVCVCVVSVRVRMSLLTGCMGGRGNRDGAAESEKKVETVSNSSAHLEFFFHVGSGFFFFAFFPSSCA